MPAVYELSLVDGGLNEKLRRPGGIGAMALADIDQDGDLDLYVAGRATLVDTQLLRRLRFFFRMERPLIRSLI